jgi:hypothetical protein
MCRDGWQGLLVVGLEAAHVGGMVADNPSGGFGVVNGAARSRCHCS